MSKHCDVDILEVQNAALVQGTSATIIVVPTSLENKELYKLRYCIKWSDATGAEVLFISVGGTVYPVLDCDGEPVRIGKLRRRMLLCLKFINFTSTAPVINPHFRLLTKLCPLCLRTPEVTATVAG